MPRVEAAQTRVSTQVISGARTSAPSDSGLGSIARGLQDIGVAASDYQKRVDTSSAEQASVQFEKAKNDLFFNPDSGYFNTQGRDAYDTAATARETLVKLQQEYSAGLESDGARRMFNSVSNKMLTRSDVDISRHAASGLQAWETATAKSVVENTVENASLYYADPDRLAVQRELGRAQLIDIAKMQGLEGEVLQENLQTYESSFAEAAITAAIAQGSADGEKAIGDYGNRLEGPDKLKVDKMLATRKKSERTQQLATESVALATGALDKFDNRQDAIDEVNKLSDDELRGKTLRELKFQYNQRKAADSEARAAAFEGVEAHIAEGGSAETYQAQNPDEWDRLSPKQKRTAESGKLVSTDWAKFSEIMTMGKAQLVKVDPTDHYDVLAPPQRQQLISAVRAAKNEGGAGDRADAQSGRSRTAETAAAVQQLFGKKSELKGEKLAQVNTFYALVDAEKDSAEQIKGGKLTSSEYTTLLASLTRKVVEEGFIFDSDRTLEDVPSEALPQISNFLRQNGVPVTSENIIRAYLDTQR